MTANITKGRCAIYTRKSNEEGLDQEYNSLEAQRDLAVNYIRSQAEQRWTVLPELYDDGGISGGTMERPALQRLLKDIQDGKVDVVVVYKIDRLSRSLYDFLGMIRLFEEHNVIFVSVTQNINSGTPMGRLMLNVLQSFAQFEMEQTGERIRDKIAASKKKGMWMGGVVPLGYDAKEGKLYINEKEAETVHYIFSRYLKLGSITPLLQDLKEKGHQTKSWVTSSGKFYPPNDFNKSSLYRILGNPIYIGKIKHKAVDCLYDGQHEAIIDQSLWDNVQALMEKNAAQKTRIPDNKDRPYLLKGLIVNPNGYALTPSSKLKGERQYRYYVSIEAIKKGAKECPVRTVAAQLVEDIILDRIKWIFNSPEWVTRMTKVKESQLRTADWRAALQHFSEMWDELFPTERARIVSLMIKQVVMHEDRILIHFRPLGMITLLHEINSELKIPQRNMTTIDIDDDVTLEVPISIRRGGARKFIKAPNGTDIVSSRHPKYDDTLIKAVIRAHDWQRQINDGNVKTIDELAKRVGMRDSYVSKIIRLTELAPDITVAILHGRQPHSLSLSQMEDIPLLWEEQRRAYGFMPSHAA